MTSREKNKKEKSGRSVRLADILKSDQAFGAWLRTRSDVPPEVFLIAAHRLEAQLKEELTAVAGRVLCLEEDLVKTVADLQAENQRLNSLSLTDDLTGMFNYRFFSAQIEVEIKRTLRTGLPFSLMMMDVDNFKLLNDTLGHQAGNEFLGKMAETVSAWLRPTDIACRFGGDEFAVIMPATHRIDALMVARRLREQIEQVTREYDVPVSCSFGIAEQTQLSVQDTRQLVERADRSLYQAKQGGKNQIFIEEKPEKAPAEDLVNPAEINALLKRG